jgi:hypothetical protein
MTDYACAFCLDGLHQAYDPDPECTCTCHGKPTVDDLCAHGHPWTEENTRRSSDGAKRFCRACEAERGRRRRAAKKPITAKQRSMQGRLAAYAMHAKHDPKVTTAAARAAFNATFLDQVDPDRTLPEDERARRAEAARKAHFARLSLQSSIARSKRGS